MISKWLRRMFWSKPKPEWPTSVRFEVIAKKLRRLQAGGHRTEVQRFNFSDETLLVLRQVPIPNCVSVGRINHQIVKRYAAMKTPFPPLVASEYGLIVDGIQRLYAARDRGDKFIDIYAPKGVKDIYLS